MNSIRSGSSSTPSFLGDALSANPVNKSLARQQHCGDIVVDAIQAEPARDISGKIRFHAVDVRVRASNATGIDRP